MCLNYMLVEDSFSLYWISLILRILFILLVMLIVDFKNKGIVLELYEWVSYVFVIRNLFVLRKFFWSSLILEWKYF